MGRVARIADSSLAIDNNQAGLGSCLRLQQGQRFPRSRIWIEAFGEKVDGSLA